MLAIRLQLRKAKRKYQRPHPINVQRLKDSKVKKAFQTEVKKRFAVLANHPEKVDMQVFNDAMVETGKELLCPGRRKKEECISDSTWKKVENRKEKKKKKTLSTKSEWVKVKPKAEYRELDREVQNGARADRKAYTERLAEEVDTADSK